MFWISVLNRGAVMDTEAYIIYGMVFGFLSLWLLFSLTKKLGGSEKFPKQNEDRESENKK